ncbi:hypothetical protein H8356DRAFT_1732271 [Neocallimastix lanati (nom. inval.)]|nr:hypothetical protein H8356DRAFT_1732271 [Neocallimastix sp. JGI-2020a]
MFYLFFLILVFLTIFNFYLFFNISISNYFQFLHVLLFFFFFYYKNRYFFFLTNIYLTQN